MRRGLCLAPSPAPEPCSGLWAVWPGTGLRLGELVLVMGLSLGMAMATGTEQLANLSSQCLHLVLSAICHDLSLPDIRLDSKTWMFSDGKRWKPLRNTQTEVVITPYQDQRRQDNKSCHQIIDYSLILCSALIHLILPVNRMNNGSSSVFSARSLVYLTLQVSI